MANWGELRAQALHAHAGQQQVEVSCRRIVSADRGAGLDRRNDEPVIDEFELDDMLMAASPAPLSPYAWLAIGAGVCGAATGMSMPAANNATLQLAPGNTAAIAGLRGMFRQAGSITAVSVSTAIVARSADPGMAQAHVFIGFAVILLCALPLVALVPEYRGRW